MFGEKFNSDNRKFCLFIKITCTGTKKFRIWAEELQRKNSKYADREIEVVGTRTIHFSFPVSPKTLFVGCGNIQNPQDKDFKVELSEGKLMDYNVWLDAETKNFLNLCIPFSQVCGFESASNNGRLYSSKDKAFNIKFFNVISDGGKINSTPARIGHTTGTIEVAKTKFNAYTIPMRVIILLHEYSHKFRNPKIGLEIGNEIGADINALYIYLGLGFSKIDAICVFANVFLKSQTKGNMERMRKINDYVDKFEKEQFAKKN